ncbi:MAG: class I SAM-dependent methyltransferase [Prolixibacteraceae bacterium]
MQNFDRKTHWESIYQTKELNEVSWYQPRPETSLQFISQYKIPFNAKIIDVGGGDSFFADHLLELGFTDVTVLDVSESALKRAKQRLGVNAAKVKWIVADASDFQAIEKYDFWHDRAAFHFLNSEAEIANYIKTVNSALNPEGILVIGTFSEQGPTKCSGIKIRQYSEESLTGCFSECFNKIECFTVDHQTPSGSIQNFIFCSFRNK